MRGDYVAWDTETTDKFPDDAPLEEAPYIIQLACVKYVNDVEIGTFETLIRLPTGVHSSEGAVAVHGITDALVMRDGISFDDAWRKFRTSSASTRRSSHTTTRSTSACSGRT